MWSSMRYFGTFLWSMSVFTAMLQDAPREVAELFDVAFPGWYLEEASPNSCLKSQLGTNYSATFRSLRRRVIDFHGANRSSGEPSVVSETALPLEEIVAQRGFSLETYNVTTEDGWQINVHRILNNNSHVGTPVLIPSFFLASSAFWLVGNRNTSLAYILADGGFDVWIGNYRGNSLFSSKRNSSHLDWTFTLNDHAIYDLPAQIDYVLHLTAHNALHVAGFSQGAITTLQMLSLRPGYNSKVLSFASLAGARTMAHVTQLPFLKYLACLASDVMVAQEILPTNDLLSTLVTGAEKEAAALVEDLIGLTTDYIDVHRLPLVMKYLPSGTSSSVLHSYYDLWKQEYRSSRVVWTFDYGAQGNLKRFRSASRVRMEAKLVTVPTKLYFSQGDVYSPPEENFKMLEDLPNVVDHFFTRDRRFSHYNFALHDRDPEVFLDVRNFFTRYNIRQ